MLPVEDQDGILEHLYLTTVMDLNKFLKSMYEVIKISRLCIVFR